MKIYVVFTHENRKNEAINSLTSPWYNSDEYIEHTIIL